MVEISCFRVSPNVQTFFPLRQCDIVYYLELFLHDVGQTMTKFVELKSDLFCRRLYEKHDGGEGMTNVHAHVQTLKYGRC